MGIGAELVGRMLQHCPALFSFPARVRRTRPPAALIGKGQASCLSAPACRLGLAPTSGLALVAAGAAFVPTCPSRLRVQWLTCISAAQVSAMCAHLLLPGLPLLLSGAR